MTIAYCITSFVEDRFWPKVHKTDSCWLWTSSLDSGGYGTIGINGTSRKSHRVSWMIHNGPIPNGLFVLHKCDVRNCVNPDHLFLGTQNDNMKDAATKGRMPSGNRNTLHREPWRAARGPRSGIHTHPYSILNYTGERSPMSKLTEVDVLRARQLAAEGITIRKLSVMFGVGTSTINQAIRGITWAHIPNAIPKRTRDQRIAD